jgi:hypothetical protein
VKQYDLSTSDLRNLQNDNGDFVARFLRLQATIAVLYPVAAIALILIGVISAGSMGRDLSDNGIVKPVFGFIGAVAWIVLFSRPALPVLATRGYAIALESDRVRFFGRTIQVQDFAVIQVRVGSFGLRTITLVLKDGQRRSVSGAYLVGMDLRQYAQS